MNLFYLSYRSIVSKPMSSFLSWLLMGFGVTIIVLVIIIAQQLEKEVSNNTRGIDLVIGAKGSPMQIILANIFHVDFPTGNISLKEAAQISRSRYVDSAVPLSLGDSYKGSRIVGTTERFIEWYDAIMMSGKWCDQPMQAVVGASVAQEHNLEIGSNFSSQHGLDKDGDAHDHDHFVVVGLLAKTNTVVDQLILTNLHSIWQVHDHDEHHENDSTVEIPHWGVSVSHEDFENGQITSVLIKYRSPMGAVMMPRQINENTEYQAASPAFESARLFNIVGVGVQVLNVFGIVIIVISAISVFIALLNSLKERKYDIAIMRSMGAGKSQVFFHILIEGLIITFAGVISGWLVGHAGIWFIAQQMEVFNGSVPLINADELMVLAGSVVLGVVASLIPAAIAYKTEISGTLSKG